ncbi:MAG: permease prefix domain 1-containing protein [Eubacteriales bacterium]|nr:permease prefix domain 1-containing protein [Eubacteriales bacterium]MDD4422119.1 permease prefix domain 1-containing protein [Eubacteriales bacterium]
MNEKLRAYIENLFEDAPKNKKTIELKEEILQNLIDKYNDLIDEGKGTEAAYNIAIASVGDISELINELNKSNPFSSEYDQTNHSKKAWMVAVSIMLYIFSVIPLMIFQDERGVVFILLFAGIATGMLVYYGMTKPKYQKIDDTLVEEFKEWKANSTEQNSLFKSISTAVWVLATIIYIIISFTTFAWHITWVIFLIAQAVNSIIKAVFDYKKEKK